MSVGIYIDPPSAILLADRFFKVTSGRHESSLARCLAFVKHKCEAQGISVHTADRMPAQQGSDTHLYVSIGNHANYHALLSRSDVVLSAFLVTESPVVEPSIFRGLGRAKHYFKRIFSCVDNAEIGRFASNSVDCLPLRWPIDFRGVDLPLWSTSERGFLVMINMNKLPRLYSNELFTERMRRSSSSAALATLIFIEGWPHAGSMDAAPLRCRIAIHDRLRRLATRRDPRRG